jgi:hypothetical protein
VAHEAKLGFLAPSLAIKLRLGIRGRGVRGVAALLAVKVAQLDYNLLYRWFVGLGVDEAAWVPTVFTKNRLAIAGPSRADRPNRPSP